MTGVRHVLMANKFYYRRGGAETYLLYLARLLGLAGYEVVPFAMAHPENLSTPYASHFVPHVDPMAALRGGSAVERVRMAAHIIYSGEAARRLDGLCRQVSIDVAHLHNIYHQLSPSILRVLKERGIPTVMTLHDYKLICPTYQLLAPDGLCERCRGGRFYQAAVQGCAKGSFLAGAVVAAEAYVHRFLRTYDSVDLFVCPSRFLLEKMVAHGWPRERFVHIPNFAPVDEVTPAAGGRGEDYIVYFGRLSPEKGLATLLRAMAPLPHVRLVVVGDGPMAVTLEGQARALGLANVSFRPRMEKDALLRTVADARFVVLPSEWYENCPLSVLEAFALGKAVVAARIGGVPELVEDGVTGLLFSPGDVRQLSDRIHYLFAQPGVAEEMGLRARRRAEQDFHPQTHVRKIIHIYETLMQKARAENTGSAHDSITPAPSSSCG